MVVQAVDQFPNVMPGQGDPYAHPAGNHVVIKKSQNEYVLLGHFSPRTVQVAVGDQVKAGDEIGQCGNSGNTTFPHLHLHVQSTPNLLNLNAIGLPIRFSRVSTLAAPGQCVDLTNYALPAGAFLC